MSFFTEPLSVGNIWDSIKSWFLPKFLKTICPHCQKIYRLPFKYDDKYIECPNCKESFWVDRYLIPVRFSGKPTTDYEEKISEMLGKSDFNRRKLKIENFEGSLYLYVKNDKYLMSFNDLLYSAEKDIPRWKIKKILTYFCTGERDWQKMIKWTSDNDLWKKWDTEYKEKLAKKRRLEAKRSNLYNFRYMLKEEIEEACTQKYANGCCAVVFIIILLAFCIPSCIDSVNNPSPRYNSRNSSSDEAAKRYLEGFGEQLIKEETRLDSNVRMNFNENTVKYSFDVKYRD